MIDAYELQIPKQGLYDVSRVVFLAVVLEFWPWSRFMEEKCERPHTRSFIDFANWIPDKFFIYKDGRALNFWCDWEEGVKISHEQGILFVENNIEDDFITLCCSKDMDEDLEKITSRLTRGMVASKIRYLPWYHCRRKDLRRVAWPQRIFNPFGFLMPTGALFEKEIFA